MIEGIFDLYNEEDSENFFLKCLACDKYDTAFTHNVDIPDYEKTTSKKQPRSFLNLKRSLVRHLKQEKHLKAAGFFLKIKS